MASAVATYSYVARDGSGKVVKGKIEAINETAVLSKLRTLGVSPITVSEAGTGTGLQKEISIPGFGPKVGLKDLAVMSRQMATMISSGLSLIKTINILADQTENKELSRILTEVRAEIESGSSLSESFAKHPLVFPRLMIHLVKAGETGGFLDGALESIAKTFESDVKLRSTIKSALTYPVAVLIMAFVAVIAMLIFIVPVFEGMFSSLGGHLPAATEFLVIISHNMIWITPLLIVLIVGWNVWWRQNKHKDGVRAIFDRLRLRLPVFGPLFKKVAIARFARNFSTMMGSGVPILQSLAIVGETSGNYVIEEALRKVQDSVRTGRSIAAPLMEEPLFPTMVTQMISVGEDSGSLEIMLEKVADFYDAEVASTAEALASLIEPLMIAVIGVVIGGMIVALYMPVFTIFNQIK